MTVSTATRAETAEYYQGLEERCERLERLTRNPVLLLLFAIDLLGEMGLNVEPKS
jgi:hypothetical protein